MPNVSSTRRFAVRAAAACAALALLVHAYLASVHYDVKYDAAKGDRVCNVGAAFNCEAVSASRYSEFFGMPLAVLGFGFNLALLGLLAAHGFSSGRSARGLAASSIAMAGGILGASVVMGGVSAFAMTQYCLFCMAAYVLSAASFAGVWVGLRDDARGSGALDLKPVAWAAVAACAFALVGDGLASQAYGARDWGPTVRASVADWLAAQPSVVEPKDPLVMGASPEAARLTVVEFADFRCIHCKHAAPTLHAFAAARPDVRFLFQPWPLDGACNPNIPGSNGASCALARASWCAARESGPRGEGLGWEAHKWLYDHMERMGTLESSEAAAAQMAVEIGLDPAKLKACMDGEEAKKAVLAQSEVGNALGLQGTPTIYANGRRLPNGQAMQILKAAYDRAGEAPLPRSSAR